MAITTGNTAAGARLLDVTRTIRRAGRRPTGIDRVELAYIEHLAEDSVPVFGLARTPLGYVLLDRDGLRGLAARCRGDVPWGTADRLSALGRGQSQALRQAQSDLRRLALARCWPPGLARILRRHLPQGTRYLNLGHSNLTLRMLRALRRIRGQVTVMVHDTIPLDYPQFQREGARDRFAAFLDRVASAADLVLCNSAATQSDLRRHLGGRCPPTLVAHLGVTPLEPDATLLPPDLPPDGPYFVVLGTIEPRKNHALLLDIWEEMARQVPERLMPHLVICGARGWNNEALLSHLDASPLRGVVLHEHPELSDGAVAALLQGAAGLLFPSHAEGYGLPPLEALSLGVPILCNNLAIYREVLGELPVYADAKDAYLWRRRIIRMVQTHSAGRASQGQTPAGWTAPSWAAHFNTVLSRI